MTTQKARPTFPIEPPVEPMLARLSETLPDVPGLGEQQLARIRDGHFAAVYDDQFLFGAGGHTR